MSDDCGSGRVIPWIRLRTRGLGVRAPPGAWLSMKHLRQKSRVTFCFARTLLGHFLRLVAEKDKEINRPELC